MEEINWDNFHHMCSNCNQPIEYGQEEYHYKCLCPTFRVPKTSEQLMRSRWDTTRHKVAATVYQR